MGQYNSVLTRENRFLREIVEYQPLTMQDVVYLDENSEEVTKVYPVKVAGHLDTGDLSSHRAKMIRKVSSCESFQKLCFLLGRNYERDTESEGRAVGDDITSLHASIKEGTKWLFNKAKGNIQTPLLEFLKEHDLPKCISPRDATHYEFNENTKELFVDIPSVCEVGYSDSSVLRFNTTVKGFFEIGKLADIEGMKTKVLSVWVKVTAITSAGQKLHFPAGMKKTREGAIYDHNRSVGCV